MYLRCAREDKSLLSARFTVVVSASNPFYGRGTTLKLRGSPP